MLIDARNAHVTKQLQQAYSELISTGELRVFCVGNDDYKKFKSLQKRGKPALIDATGVPSLRQFCRSVPAKAQFKNGLQFLEAQIPVLLRSIELWVSAGPGKGPGSKPEDVADQIEHLEQVSQIP